MEISDMALILTQLPEETLEVMHDAVHEFLNTRPDVDKAITGIALRSAIVEAENRQTLAKATGTIRVKSVRPAFDNGPFAPGTK